MSGGSNEKVVYVKKVNVKNLVIIIMVFVGLFTVFKFTNTLSMFKGESTTDGRKIITDASEWNGNSVATKFSGTNEEVFIPDISRLRFDSEKTVQRISIGNPKSNNLNMSVDILLNEKNLYSSGILPPGHGIEKADLKACFEPMEYRAVLVYKFYKKDGLFLTEFDHIKCNITIDAEGSGLRYKEGMSKFSKK